jgi:ABC-type phosphate transport system substrate-binding protein
MSNRLLVAVEGPGAGDALADLLATTGVVGTVQATDHSETVREPVTLATIGVIVAIAAGVSTVANNIVQWREKWQKANEGKRLSVVIEDAKGNRLALDRATPEQITAALQSIAGNASQ